jgi:repressor LexA
MPLNKDEKYKRSILRFFRDHKRLPTFRELLPLAGFASTNAAHRLTERLVASGFLSRDRKGKLAPGRIYGEIKLLGLVEAGFPSPAEEELSDTMSLDDYLIDNKEASYILRVKGDSMIDAGICEGDMVIVERKSNPKVGEIVIAEVDGGWTMKYLRKRQDGQFYLEPANRKYKPIYPKEDLKIAAVVKAVIRKYS